MRPLSEAELKELNALLEKGDSLPQKWQHRLFPAKGSNEIGKEYSLVYEGKMRREEILAKTPAAPWQLVRSFSTTKPNKANWKNLLVWGDNLMAMRELLEDQRGPNNYKTRGKIKLIYIDPPFATKSDFFKDKEKAYRDKVYGARFIEFLRKRLVLLKELLSDDGSIYVHLDTKKGHYIKVILDEIFGENNFQNEIIWQRTNSHNETGQFGRVHDSIYFYTKSESHIWHPPKVPFSQAQLKRYKRSPDGRLYTTQDLCAERRNSNSGKFNWRGTMPPPTRGWGYKLEQLEEWWKEGRIALKKDGTPRMDGLIVYLDETKGQVPQSIWTDVGRVANTSSERVDYPTQKSESLIERIILASSNREDIVLDCFSGSGTTLAVAEKLDRRWVGMDSSKLAIYTTQKRLFSLTNMVGRSQDDNSTEIERIDDWEDILKKNSAIFLMTERARKGESEVTLDLLHDLRKIIVTQNILTKYNKPFTIICPEDKLRIPQIKLKTPENPPGNYTIKIEEVNFSISIISKRRSKEKEEALRPAEFSIFRSGMYDMAIISDLPWPDYRIFALKLFGIVECDKKRYGVRIDGYLGIEDTLIWNYPDHKNQTLDYDYVKSLHQALRGKPGERIHVIAPVVAMSFMEDEVVEDETTYVFHKVPMSVLLRLIEQGSEAALHQPMKEADVNEVIDAVGFDFISQPQVQWKAKLEEPEGELIKDCVIELTEFRAQTLTTDPEDFENFETFSMAMVDLNYDGDIFKLDRVFWGEDLVTEEIKRVNGLRKKENEKRKAKDKLPEAGLKDCESLKIRIPEADFVSDELMVILCDRYGNEKCLRIKKTEFKSTSRKRARKRALKRVVKKATKKAAKKASTKAASKSSKRGGKTK